tara:strand:- start:854 stop:997 length:144 start_codon:yes stop_codon:yes gene_type:complete
MLAYISIMPQIYFMIMLPLVKVNGRIFDAPIILLGRFFWTLFLMKDK